MAMSWISLNAQWAIASGAIKYETKPLTVDHCNYEFGEALLGSTHNFTISPAGKE